MPSDKPNAGALMEEKRWARFAALIRSELYRDDAEQLVAFIADLRAELAKMTAERSIAGPVERQWWPGDSCPPAILDGWQVPWPTAEQQVAAARTEGLARGLEDLAPALNQIAIGLAWGEASEDPHDWRKELAIAKQRLAELMVELESKLQPPAQEAPSQAAASPARTVDGQPSRSTAESGSSGDAVASEGEYSDTDSGTLQPVEKRR